MTAKGKGALIRSSHFRPQPARQPLSATPNPVDTRKAQQRAEQVRTARPSQKQALLKRLLNREQERKAKLLLDRPRERKVPRDSVIRTAAKEAASVHRKSVRILRFEKAVRTYCGLALGYHDRNVVEEFVYLRLKQMIEKRKQEAAATVAKLKNQFAPLPQKLASLIRDAFKPVTPADIERLAEHIFREVEAHIGAIADYGRKVERESPHGYRTVRGTISFTRSRICFLVLEDNADGPSTIVAFKTARDFDRDRRHRFNRRERIERFSQPPPVLRH